jgi:hypothetical protein
MLAQGATGRASSALMIVLAAAPRDPGRLYKAPRSHHDATRRSRRSGELQLIVQQLHVQIFAISEVLGRRGELGIVPIVVWSAARPERLMMRPAPCAAICADTSRR